MTTKITKEKRVLSIYPNTRGVGYAVFEGLDDALDWGGRIAGQPKNAECLKKVKELIVTNEPDVLVVEDHRGEASRRSQRIEELIDAIVALAKERGIETRTYSRAEMRKCFSEHDAFNKEEMAHAIAKQLPEFTYRLPPSRKIWMCEDRRMGIFDAVALIFTYYWSEVGKAKD